MNQETKTQSNVSLQNESSDKLLDLLQANLEMSEKILKISQDLKKHMQWQHFWVVFRLIIIIGPIILGFIYLPPLIKDYLAAYKSLLP